MSEHRLHPAVARLVEAHGEDLAEILGERMSGADLTALMLEVIQRRVGGLSAAKVLEQYERDRFVQPATVDARRLLELEVQALDTVAPPFAPVATSPLVPLGTHSVVAGVHQNRVVTTTRGSEVAADPTNTLALEAAVRRRALLATEPRSDTPVHLASVDRIVRGQRFHGPRSFAHFSLLGLVSAGRDTGSSAFETRSLQQQLQALGSVCDRVGFEHVTISLTDFEGHHRDLVDTLVGELAGENVAVTAWPGRTDGRDYYRSVCFKLHVVHRGGGDRGGRRRRGRLDPIPAFQPQGATHHQWSQPRAPRCRGPSGVTLRRRHRRSREARAGVVVVRSK